MTLDSFRERYERELANDLGNLLSRTTAMIARYRDGDLAPAPDESGELAAAASALHDDIPAALDRWDVTGALDTIWDYVRRLNRHVEQTKPWELAKDPDRAAELDRALYELADGLRIAAVALCGLPARDVGADPRGPRAAGRRRLGQRRVRPHRSALSGIEPAQPLFPRIDEPATAA